VEVMFCEETHDVFCMTVTPACSEGALGTWRSQGGPRTLSRDKPAFEVGTRSWVNQRGWGVRMSVLKPRRESGKAHEGKPRSEPERGNPAFRDRRGACGNVATTGAGLRPIGKPLDRPPDPTVACAPHFYPNRFLKLPLPQASLSLGQQEVDIQDVADAVRPKDSNVRSRKRCEGVVLL
jgi:hypothetical protein